MQPIKGLLLRARHFTGKSKQYDLCNKCPCALSVKELENVISAVEGVDEITVLTTDGEKVTYYHEPYNAAKFEEDMARAANQPPDKPIRYIPLSTTKPKESC